ncbi:MAG: hypothetical protein HYS04_21150 [Acidobacteria bacterium]|nr:hypothetical protein [Acidobacteriota bacterium]
MEKRRSPNPALRAAERLIKTHTGSAPVTIAVDQLAALLDQVRRLRSALERIVETYEAEGTGEEIAFVLAEEARQALRGAGGDERAATPL